MIIAFSPPAWTIVRCRRADALSIPSQAAAQDIQSASVGGTIPRPENAAEISNSIPGCIAAMANPFDGTAYPARWLCPIQSDSERRGILHMTAAEYFDLVDRSGWMTRSDKRGAVDADLAPILLRIGVNPDMWLETVTRFGSKFRLAAGLLANLRNFADQLGGRWLKGIAAARAAFESSPPQLA